MKDESVLIEFIVKIRDAAAEALDQFTPSEVKIEKPTNQEFNNLQWETKTSDKGDYEQTKNNDSIEFNILQAWLSENKGFGQLHGFKVWFHVNDENVIDRRRT